MSGATPPYPSVFACMLLSRTDELRLCGFPKNVIDAVNETIKYAWPRGLQRHYANEGAWEWKFYGYPWYGEGKEAILGRRLMTHILRTLSSQGWILHASCDLTKKVLDKDTLFFRAAPYVERTYFNISFDDTDKVQIIDSPSDEVTSAFTTAVQTWKKGIQESREKEPGAFRMKLRGTPWEPSEGEFVRSKILACHILSAMDNQGYELVASVNMGYGVNKDASTPDLTVDTWFFASKVLGA